jgi:hypothetical protein
MMDSDNRSAQFGHDSPVERQVSALDRSERERLEREFREAGASLGDGAEEQTSQRTNKSNSSAGKDKKKNALTSWQRFILFIEQLFTGITEEEFIKKQAITALATRVRAYKPQLYNVRTNQLLPPLAEIVYKISEIMGVLRQIYEDCQMTGPDTGSRGFVEFFIRRIEPDLPDLEARYSYEYVKENPKLFEKGQIKATIDRDLDKMIASLSQDKRGMINVLSANGIAYQRLAFFNFFSFLRRFGDTAAFAAAGTPVFSPADANEALFDLTRLEELICSIDLALNMNEMFSALVAYADLLTNEVGTAEETGPRNTRDSWRKGTDARCIPAISSLIKDERLSTIIRIISHAPDRTLNMRRITATPLEEMAASLRVRLLSKAEKLQHQIEIDELGKRIFELFGDTDIPDIEFYNEETNKRLQTLGLPIFLYCRQLQVVKAFHNRMFEPLVRPALNSVVVDGDFANKLLQTSLADYFYKFADLYVKVQDFEKRVSADEPEGEKNQNTILRYSGDQPTYKTVSDKIHLLNSLAGKTLKAIGEVVVGALPPLSAIIKDVHEIRKPEFIRNIYQIGGQRNKLIIKAVQHVYEVTNSLAGILEPFVKGDK